MTIHHTLADGMFGAKTQKELIRHSFAFVFPEMRPRLGLPFAGVHENAKVIYENRRKKD